MKRCPDVVILSDLHLGTYGCHSKELLLYLKSIKPGTLILNGDIIDIWYFKKSYFPKDHLEVIRRILKLANSGTKVYYLTGNHDDMLRKFGETDFGMIQLRNKLVFKLADKTHWVFHGDVFDASIHSARWLAKLGGKGYDMLIRVNRVVNYLRNFLGLSPVSFSAKVKRRVKGAVKHISDFEKTAIELACEKGYDYVICGHIHQPQMRQITMPNGTVTTYMNSGDWVENLTALEYYDNDWHMFQYHDEDFNLVNPKLVVAEKETNPILLSREEMIPEIPRLAAFDF